MNAASDFTFPLELLDEFIDQLDETSALFSFGLVSKRALVKTRRRLFSTLGFMLDEDFDRFLDLAGAPWTSFTSAVQQIHLQDLFLLDYTYGNARDPKTVASNLRNVKTLSIFLHSPSNYGWRRVPCSVLDVISKLEIHNLQLEGVDMEKTGDMVMLFGRLSPTLKTLAFRGLTLKIEDSDLSRSHLSIFRRPLHFRILDNISLACLKDVLDPLANPGLDVTVHTFHIRSLSSPADNPLTWRFLEHIGHGVKQLVVAFAGPYGFTPLDARESMKYLEPNQVVQLINLRSLFIGFCGFRMDVPLLVSAMWKMLSALPSPNLLEELKFKFTLWDTPSIDDHLCMCDLGFFESPNCLDKFRSMFPNLTLIKIILNIRKPEKTDVFFEKLRRRVKGLRKLEEIGIVKLATFDMELHVGCHSVLEACM
ncbi:hypothetical protein F5887DRAFT_1160047 [Amanita rubescens]|nr:hypothetical protein F5887DRAFT_1160047 [Amanita rubescens]